MTTSSRTSITISGRKNGSNSAAWQRLSEIEKKARGVLGVSRLKAHVGRLDLNSKGLFCFGSVTLLTHHTSTSVKLDKDRIERWTGTTGGLSWMLSWLTFVLSRCVLDSTDFYSVHLCYISHWLTRKQHGENNKPGRQYLICVIHIVKKKER